MTEKEQRAAAKAFADEWKGKGYEKGESQVFWMSLLHDVYGVDHPSEFIKFEQQVHLDHTSFIDGVIPSTKVLIEQKGLGKDLDRPIKQNDGSYLNPFKQAKRYITELPVSQHPRWVITCNFEMFYIYDMEKPSGEPEKIALKDLEKEYYRLQFLTDTGKSLPDREMEISIKAGEVVGLLYDAFHAQYRDPDSEASLRSLNKLCVRLVFCLYAEDSGLFGKHLMFHDYLEQFDTKHMRKALVDLFRVLDQKEEDRDPYLDEDLAAFPYVNGGLFAEEDIEIPQFTDEIRELLLQKASADFDWSEISPTIFGAVFESTLNPETRRNGGMHYTSIENIHKVIDPFFLDDLKAEFEEIKALATIKTKEKRLREYQTKLASLEFLDPAAGSGNFLTETYLSIRRLENEVLSELYHGQILFGFEGVSPIKVSIEQFHGIEINDFAVTVAKTALWIAESQMMKGTENIVLMDLDFLPLKTNANIVEGNALRLDWESVVPKDRLNYIMGNPPFIGYAYQSESQKRDLMSAVDNRAKNIDYVAGWYYVAAKYMKNTKISCAFVSTNSITQGEQVTAVWKALYEEYGLKINFAYRTFRWDSEASIKAQVHCVIIGFDEFGSRKEKQLFSGERKQIVDNINFYLMNAPTVFLEKRTKPICCVPEIVRGSSPNDDGNLLMTEEEYNEYIKREPDGKLFIRPFMMGKDFIYRKPRYCFWLVGAKPELLKKCPILLQKIEAVRAFRSASKRSKTLELAETPTLFEDMRISDDKYVAIPKVSSEGRRYIPIDYLEGDVIPGDKLFFMKNASLYDFGVLNSNVHNAWMRAVCGRLKSDYSYSNTIVYNNFPWPTLTEEQRRQIEVTAQGILDARNKYPDASLADLYDERVMPKELRTAHQLNDAAVMKAYGFPIKGFTESDCVAELMKMYQKLVGKEKKR